MKRPGLMWYLSVLVLLTGFILVTGCAPPNNPPVIDSLQAAKNPIVLSGTSEIKCLASDPDGDILTYKWSANGGIFNGQGSDVTWAAPAASGTYTILVDITDGKKDKVSGQLDIAVRVNHPPVIESLKAIPPQILQGAVSRIECTATDPDGDALSYQWSASRGNISGDGAIVSWTAPLACADYTITVNVKDVMGAAATKDVIVKVAKPG